MRIMDVLCPPGLVNLLLFASDFTIRLISMIAQSEKQLKMIPPRQDCRYLSGPRWPHRAILHDNGSFARQRPGTLGAFPDLTRLRSPETSTDTEISDQ